MYSFVFVFEKLIDYHQIIDWLKNVTGNTKTITKNDRLTHNMIGIFSINEMKVSLQNKMFYQLILYQIKSNLKE